MGIKKLKTFKRINELEEGETIVTFFLVDSLDIRKKSDGSDYLAIRLKDRTGTVDAKIWENVQRFSELKEGDVVKIEAEVRSYRGKADLRILRMRLLEDRDYEDGFDMKWIEEWSDYDIEELWSRLKQMTDLIDSEAIRRLVHAVLGAKETVFKRVPAAKSMHHSFFGGLLEHTVWLVDNCLRLLDNYKELNQDIVIAGAVLHDIGKTEELSSEATIDYTVEGRLVGHIILGRDILLRHAQLIPDFPEDILKHLEHVILAHQGEHEWGSPVLPATPEAFFIHMMDNLDAKLRMFLHAMKKAPEGKTFSEYHRTLGRFIYLERPETEGNDE